MNTEPTNEIAAAYRAMITSAVERVCIKRIEEEEGRVPSADEISEHGDILLDPETGSTVFQWTKGPICELVTAGYKADGKWHDAVISEFRPRLLKFLPGGY